MPRLFVALELDAEVRAALADWADAAAPAQMRRVPADNIHVTLAFLGARPDDEVETVARVIREVARHAGKLVIGDPIWLPVRRPGVLAVELRAGPRLAELHASLVERLVAEIGFKPEQRALRPHVTVARVRRGERLQAVRPATPPALAFEPSALVLYRSHTDAGGARYEALERVPQRP